MTGSWFLHLSFNGLTGYLKKIPDYLLIFVKTFVTFLQVFVFMQVVFQQTKNAWEDGSNFVEIV